MAVLSFILGRPVFFLFVCIDDGDGSNAMILSVPYNIMYAVR